MLNLQETLKKRAKNALHAFRPTRQFKTKSKSKIPLILTTLFLFSIFGFAWFNKEIKRIENRQNNLQKSIKVLERGILPPGSLGKIFTPNKLAGIPLGEDTGLVLGVKKIDIRNVQAPYNPSLIKSAFGYDLFFRYDVVNPNLEHSFFSSCIAVASFNHEFEQTNAEFKRINLQTEYAEDPRVLLADDQLYLFSNQLNENNPKCRFMCISNLDRNSYDVRYNTVLDMNLQWVEKNWSPFAYSAEGEKPRLFLEYKIDPRKLFELPNPEINELKNIVIPTKMAYLPLLWPYKWGELRGGTPAQKVDDEYLGFFHSQFTDENGLIWYVMGAYTFNAKPPFNMTRISNYPILFNGIYETPPTNTAPVGKMIIFPCGFVIEKQGQRELIHLSCGENDSGIKIVSIDKKKLFENMIQLKNDE